MCARIVHVREGVPEPTKLTQSKTFPFVKGDEVLIVVDEKKRRLVVEKLEPRTV